MQKSSAGKVHGDAPDDIKTIPIAVLVKGDAIAAYGSKRTSSRRQLGLALLASGLAEVQ
jgi:hypothetical protein